MNNVNYEHVIINTKHKIQNNLFFLDARVSTRWFLFSSLEYWSLYCGWRWIETVGRYKLCVISALRTIPQLGCFALIHYLFFFIIFFLLLFDILTHSKERQFLWSPKKMTTSYQMVTLTDHEKYSGSGNI